MKKIMITVFFCFICTVSYAGVFGNSELRNPDASYELDTWGANSEVYEFTPKTSPDTVCVVYILDNLKSVSMECFPKTPKKRK